MLLLPMCSDDDGADGGGGFAHCFQDISWDIFTGSARIMAPMRSEIDRIFFLPMVKIINVEHVAWFVCQ